MASPDAIDELTDHSARALGMVAPNPLERLALRLPPVWTSSRRRRRLLFLALAAPGFFAIFATPLHRNLLIMIAGAILFAAAIVFRARTEPLFERAYAASLPPRVDPSQLITTESHNA